MGVRNKSADTNPGGPLEVLLEVVPGDVGEMRGRRDGRLVEALAPRLGEEIRFAPGEGRVVERRRQVHLSRGFVLVETRDDASFRVT